MLYCPCCGSSSAGRATASQAVCREFESRLPLQQQWRCGRVVRQRSAKPFTAVRFCSSPPKMNPDDVRVFSFQALRKSFQFFKVSLSCAPPTWTKLLSGPFSSFQRQGSDRAHRRARHAERPLEKRLHPSVLSPHSDPPSSTPAAPYSMVKPHPPWGCRPGEPELPPRSPRLRRRRRDCLSSWGGPGPTTAPLTTGPTYPSSGSVFGFFRGGWGRAEVWARSVGCCG